MNFVRRVRLLPVWLGFAAVAIWPISAQQVPTTPPALSGRSENLIQLSGQVVQAVEFRGLRRMPQDTAKGLVATKAGGFYNEEALREDLVKLRDTRRFDDVRVESEPGRTGLIVRFVVAERRASRIENPVSGTVTVSEVLDRFKDRRP